MRNKKNILFFGEVPPGVVHGISLSNRRILSYLDGFFDIYKIENNSAFGGFWYSVYVFFVSMLRVFHLRKIKFDIYYVNLPTSFLGLLRIYFSVLFVRFLSPSVKVISHLHRGDFLSFIGFSMNKFLFKFFASKIDLVLVLSSVSKAELSESMLIDEKKIRVVKNTIEFFSNEKQNITRKNTRVEKNFYCLCNYIPTKRIHRLVSIANQKPVFFIDFNGTVSSNNYMEKLEALNVNNACDFGGVVIGKNKEEKLKNSRALVLPSLNEGMPLVILESLAHGTPVICFDIGYISDYLGDDYPGLVRELTDEAFREKMNWLNQLSENDYQNFRELSFRIFWEYYSPDKINEDILSVFQGCISQSSI